jgi:hypothetical protein
LIVALDVLVLPSLHELDSRRWREVAAVRRPEPVAFVSGRSIHEATRMR